MQISIFGGSFNPIHVGHLALAEAVLREELSHEVWFLVSPHNPLKQRQGLWDDELRLRLAELAVSDMPGMRVCDIEFSLPQPSYMTNTLTALRTRYPEHSFSLLIGEDNLNIFHKWYHYEEILKYHKLIVYPRKAESHVNIKYDAQILKDAPYIDISSTEIRNNLVTNPHYNGEGLPEKVWQYLKKHEKDLPFVFGC